MRRKLADSRGIVTGASSGIGRAITVELRRRGARVLAVARRQARLEALKQEYGIAIYAGDICAPETRTVALEQARQQFGGIDFLVNAAGISTIERFADGSAEVLRQIMEVNFFAAAELIREAIPMLRQGRAPLVVNVGSILGYRGIPWHSEYCASKFALRGLSESIRPELARSAIDLLMVSPGTTSTELYADAPNRQRLPWKTGDGVSPERVARLTAQAMLRGSKEIIPNRRGKLLVWLSRHCPPLIDRAIRRYMEIGS
jgi:short-subunit dehydrogenase